MKLHYPYIAPSCLPIYQYYKLPDMVIGGYDHVLGEDGEPLPLEFRLRQYREADLNISESRFVLNGNIDEIYCKYDILYAILLSTNALSL